MPKKEKKEESKKHRKEKEERLLDIEVKVGRAHSSPKIYTLNGQRSVMDALNAAGLVKKDSEIISVNGKEVDEDDLADLELEDGDRVTLVRNVEGGR
jgi:sulfur carrier protein ThiS